MRCGRRWANGLLVQYVFGYLALITLHQDADGDSVLYHLTGHRVFQISDSRRCRTAQFQNQT